MAKNPFKQERIDFAKFHKNAEKEALPLFRKALAKTIAPVLNWIDKFGIENVPVSDLINKTVWLEVYPKAYQLIGMKSARREFYYQRKMDGMESETKASAIDFLVDVWSTQLRDYALQYTYDIQQRLNQTTIDIIARALDRNYGLAIDRTGLIRLLKKDVNGAMKIRSGTITRTETTTIANLGKDIGARGWIEQTGSGGYKMWLGRVIDERPTHIATNDTIIEIDDQYSVGGHLCERPGDTALPEKERINCRCTQSFMSGNRYNQYVKRGMIINGKVPGAS